MHHFRDEGLRDGEKPPSDRIVIFDEAQRAWTRRKAEQWMKSRKGIADFQMSEPEFLIQYMDRHPLPALAPVHFRAADGGGIRRG